MNMIEAADLYPLRFEPIYKERMWGGCKLAAVLQRRLPNLKGSIGESWEFVDRADEQSVVSEGPLRGKTLRQLVEQYGKALVGKNFKGGGFPLLVKLIDAGQRLSLQVHPDADACSQIGGNAEPKTEMWYIIAADKGASIIAGLKPRSTKRQLVEKLHSAEMENLLQVFPSIPGDAYFIYAGTIHAIGAGNLLLEIQQNSDTTYRISDWGRVGLDGKPRDLNIEKGMAAINFAARTLPRIAGVSDIAFHNRKFPVVNKCPFFEVSDLRIVDQMPDNTNFRSFHVLTAINHAVEVGRGELLTKLKPGESCLMPACFGAYVIKTLEQGESTVVKTTL